MMSEIALLEKDHERIKDKIASRATKGGVTQSTGDQEKETTYSSRDANKQRVANEKELKRIWAEEVKIEGSRSFFDRELIKVHWLGAYTPSKASHGDANALIRDAMQFIRTATKDEISCFGYLPEQAFDVVHRPVGVIIEGWTTFAYGTDAATHMTSRGTAADRAKKSRGRLHKRPTSVIPAAGAESMVTDKESWIKDVGRTSHEVTVANWRVTGVVVNEKYFEDEAAGARRVQETTASNDKVNIQNILERYKKLNPEREALREEFKSLNVKLFDTKGNEIEIPNPFSLDVASLSSPWELLIRETPTGSRESNEVTATTDGDPQEDEMVIKNKFVRLNSKNLSKSIKFQNCNVGNTKFSGVRGARIEVDSCDSLPTLVTGTAALVVKNAEILSLPIEANFKLSSVRFENCSFSEFSNSMPVLRQHHEDDGAPITFENCTGLSEDAGTWSRAPGSSAPTPLPPPPPVFYYHGPGKPGVTQVPANIIADFIRADRSGDHKVHINGNWVDAASFLRVSESRIQQLVREELLNEDVRRRGGKWCAYVDDKLTKAEKEGNPKKYKGKAVGSVQRTPEGKIRMKARACYASKKKANNAMAAAMMEGNELSDLEQLLEEISEIESLLEGRKPPPGYLWKNIRKRRKAGKRRLKPGEKGYPKTLDFD